VPGANSSCIGFPLCRGSLLPSGIAAHSVHASHHRVPAVLPPARPRDRRSASR
jgi:hypothetical protein